MQTVSVLLNVQDIQDKFLNFRTLKNITNFRNFRIFRTSGRRAIDEVEQRLVVFNLQPPTTLKYCNAQASLKLTKLLIVDIINQEKEACLEHVENEEFVSEFLANLIHVDSHKCHVRSTQLVRRLLYIISSTMTTGARHSKPHHRPLQGAATWRN